MNFWQSPITSLRSMWRTQVPKVRQLRHWYAPSLDREVAVDIYLPPDYKSSSARQYPMLILNDGQDLPRMDFVKILSDLYRTQRIPYLVVVAVHAGAERMREYGTARQVDYKGRGDKAGAYSDFIVEELVPFIADRFRLSLDKNDSAIAGFSLGGLSALDIGWSNPDLFGSVGVFSGALWWRWSPVDDADPDADRIMHDIIHTTADQRTKEQFFWFQAGTKDEEDDRNNNGIIDAIDDTIDCMRELQSHGFHDEQIRYVEIEDGTHDPATWGMAMPDFLIWTFARGFGH